MDKAQQDALKKAAGIEAAKLIQNGMIAGLGTGSTVRFLVDELGRRVKEEGLEFTGVTTPDFNSSYVTLPSVIPFFSSSAYSSRSEERRVGKECRL